MRINQIKESQIPQILIIRKQLKMLSGKAPDIWKLAEF